MPPPKSLHHATFSKLGNWLSQKGSVALPGGQCGEHILPSKRKFAFESLLFSAPVVRKCHGSGGFVGVFTKINTATSFVTKKEKGGGFVFSRQPGKHNGTTWWSVQTAHPSEQENLALESMPSAPATRQGQGSGEFIVSKDQTDECMQNALERRTEEAGTQTGGCVVRIERPVQICDFNTQALPLYNTASSTHNTPASLSAEHCRPTKIQKLPLSGIHALG